MGFLSKLYESVRVNSTLVDHPNDNEIYNASTQTIGSGNESVTADDITVTNDPHLKGESDNERMERGDVDPGSITASSNDDFSNQSFASNSVTFGTAFSSTPSVTVGPPFDQGIVAAQTNASTTGVDIAHFNYRSTSVDPSTTYWIAVGPE